MRVTGRDEPYTGAHPELEVLAEYAAGDAEEERARAVAAHLPTCARCRGEVESYNTMSAMLRNLPQFSPPRSFALDELAVRRERRPSIWPAWASLAASIVLAIGMISALGGLPGASESAMMGAGGGTQAISDQSTSAGAEADQPRGNSGSAPGAPENEDSGQDTGAVAGATSVTSGSAAQEGAIAPGQATIGTGRQARRVAPKAPQPTSQSVSGGAGASGQPGPVATLVADTPAVGAALNSPTPVRRAVLVAPTVTPVLVRDTPPASEVTFDNGAGNGLLALLLGAMSALAFAFSAYFFVRARTA